MAVMKEQWCETRVRAGGAEIRCSVLQLCIMGDIMGDGIEFFFSVYDLCAATFDCFEGLKP